MWNFLDAIPVVGHVKGVVHYATGDTEAGNRAMLQSTRSTAVMGAGAAGFVAGPAGSAALGASAGALWDCVESVATDEPKGLIKDVTNVCETASKGEVPVTGILMTGLTVGGDLLGGLGGGSMASSVSKAAGQSAAKSVGKTATKSAGETILKSASVPVGETFGKSAAQSAGKSAAQEAGKSVAKTAAKEVGKTAAKSAARETGKSVGKAVVVEVAETVTEVVLQQACVQQGRQVAEQLSEATSSGGGRGSGGSGGGGSTSSSGGGTSGGTASSSTGRSTGSSNTGSASGSGGQPPQQNPRPTSNPYQESPWSDLLEIFGVQRLEDVVIRGVNIFDGIPQRERKYLRWLLKRILRTGYFRNVLTTVVQIISGFGSIEDITPLNFMSLCEFVMKFLEEHMKQVHECSTNAPGTFSETAASVSREIIRFSDYLSTEVISLFRVISGQIETLASGLPLHFRDMFSAVSHYFKHRLDVGTQELSVQTYYGLIASNLPIIMQRQDYEDFLADASQFEYDYTRFYECYGGTLLIAIKKQGGRISISTVHFRK